MFEQKDLPNWITPADFEALQNKHPHLELCEIESLTTKGAKLEFFVKPPDGTAYAASMRYITNSKENTNDVVKMQQTMFDFCYVTGEPKLTEELSNEACRARLVFGIGQLIGEAFPMPEGAVKKSFKRA